MKDGTPLVRVEGVTATYEDSVILENVSFDVHRGEIVVILGTSGSGKSTLLKLLIGLKKPTAGRVLIDGQDLVQAEGAQRARILRRIGVGYQHGALFGSMTLIDNVRLPMEELTHLPDRAMDLIARMKLHLVGLEDSADLMPAELSGGMQKRAAIARAMVLDPEILFLDEPSAGLDPITSAGLDQLVLELARSHQITFIIVSHELESVCAIADRAIMLDGRTKGILASGAPDELRNHPNPRVQHFFQRVAAEPL